MIGIDDRELDTSRFSEICTLCRHMNIVGHRICAAFPDGIPMQIWDGDNNHREPYPGDNGIRFEPIEQDEGQRQE